MTTTTRIVRIGNSRGSRVRKLLLEQAQLPEEVILQAEPGRLVMRASRRIRDGWSDAARRLHEHADDRLRDAPAPSRFDSEAWAWQ